MVMTEKHNNFKVSQSTSNQSLMNYMASFATQFSSLVCMCANHLAMKCNYYSRLLN